MRDLPNLCEWCLSTPARHDRCLGHVLRYRDGVMREVPCECDCAEQESLW